MSAVGFVILWTQVAGTSRHQDTLFLLNDLQILLKNSPFYCILLGIEKKCVCDANKKLTHLNILIITLNIIQWVSVFAPVTLLEIDSV